MCATEHSPTARTFLLYCGSMLLDHCTIYTVLYQVLYHKHPYRDILIDRSTYGGYIAHIHRAPSTLTACEPRGHWHCQTASTRCTASLPAPRYHAARDIACTRQSCLIQPAAPARMQGCIRTPHTLLCASCVNKANMNMASLRASTCGLRAALASLPRRLTHLLLRITRPPRRERLPRE